MRKPLALLAIVPLLAASLRAQDSADEREAQERRWKTMLSSTIAYVPDGSDAVEVKRDLRYSDADPRLRATIYTPPSSVDSDRFPVVFFLHGGGGADAPVLPTEWGPYISWGRAAAASGMVGVTFNHRLGYPEPRFDQAASDVKAMIAYVRAHAAELHADTSRICLASYSAGGPLLSLALRGDIPGVKCLVAFYSFLDLRGSDWRGDAATLAAWSPAAYAERATTPPIFVAAGGRDEIPEVNESVRRFVDAAMMRNSDVTAMLHPQGEHGFDIAKDERSAEIIRAALEFMQRRLGVTDDGDLAKTLLDLEAQRRAAIAAKDFATLSRIYAPEFVTIFGNGENYDRAKLFEVFKGDDPALVFTTDELNVRRFGEAAIVTGRLTARAGEKIVSQQRFTHTYARRGGRWWIVAAEGTPVRNPR